MAAHRWDTEPTPTLPSRLALRRPERLPTPSDAARSRTGSAGTQPDAVLPEGAQPEPAGQPPSWPRRWRFPVRAAALTACLLLAAAVAIPLVQNREPHETIAVELGAGVEAAGDAGPDFPPLSDDAPDESRDALSDPANAEDHGAGGNPGAAAQDEPFSGPEGAASTGPEFVVHVAGAVARPGIVQIKPGARVADAVEAAGGATPEADLALVNLAALMEDGSMVVVPALGTEAAGPAGVPAAGNPPGSGTGSGAAGSGPGNTGGPGTDTGPVNLNTASDAELQTLPRVGPVLAARILAWRTDHGRFARPEDLDAIPGIGEAMLAALLPLVTV